MDDDAIKAQDAKIKAHAQRVRQELPETEAVLGRMREQAVSDMFDTQPSEAEKREQLYRSVKTIDLTLQALRGAVQAGEQVDMIAARAASLDNQPG